MKYIAITLILLISALLSSCTAENSATIPDVMLIASDQTLKSDINRADNPDISNSDKSDIVKANSTFAFDLYAQLKQQDANIVVSPYSISSAMAMVYAGAGGETEKQIAETLRFTLSREQLHPAFNWLDTELEKRGELNGVDSENFTLNTANALWGQKNYKFKKSFLDTLAANYGAGLRIVDFNHETEQARNTINDWVSRQTANRINEILSKDNISQTTRLVLTNAVYFNATWDIPFQPYARDFTFHLPDSREIIVPAMSQNNSYNYCENSEYQAIELPYTGNELSMLVILPREDRFDDFETDLNENKLSRIVDRLEEQAVIIKMPEFTFESQFSLSHTLSDMGMPDAFSELQADFSGISDAERLLIDNIFHKAFIVVDQEGTEAAAITSISVIPVSMDYKNMQPVEMIVDRPFIFLIRDINTGTILFLGRVMDPSQ